MKKLTPLKISHLVSLVNTLGGINDDTINTTKY